MPSSPLFKDRVAAGKQLATTIAAILDEVRASGVSAPPIVYALPRGGVPVAAQVARFLSCPLDIIVAKKISLPENPELAIGAVTTDGQIIWAEHAPWHHLNPQLQQAVVTVALNKAQSQLAEFRTVCPETDCEGAIAMVIDDGIATGMTMAVAAQALRAKNPAAVWLCAPVAPPSLLPWMQQWGDRVIVLETPLSFLSVSRFYAEFPQVSTEEALEEMRGKG